MPNNAFNWMTRIKGVEREYGAIRFGTDLLLVAVSQNPAVLVGQVRRSDIGTASRSLEGTYLVRVFSEFETALQHFIRAFRMRQPRGAEALINRVQGRGQIPQPVTDAVHRVREYRNVLVHDRLQPAAVVTIREATSHLCIYLSRLQRMW